MRNAAVLAATLAVTFTFSACGEEASNGNGGGGSSVDSSGSTADIAAAADSGASTDIAATVDAAPLNCSDQAQLNLYKKRIKPLVDGSQPSSCNQCHLAGVDLAMYVQKNPCETMACMAANGMVDLKNPKASKILQQILLAKPQSTLITKDVIQAEYDGMLEWISHLGPCMDQTCGKIDKACQNPSKKEGETGGAKALLGDCSEKDLAASFQQKIWKQKGRCSPCHVPPGSTQWNSKVFFANTGKPAIDALNSMYNVIGIGAINVETPDQSLLLLMPLAQSAGGLPHKGHTKLANKNDKNYKSFLAWIKEYAACQKK